MLVVVGIIWYFQPICGDSNDDIIVVFELLCRVMIFDNMFLLTFVLIVCTSIVVSQNKVYTVKEIVKIILT